MSFTSIVGGSRGSSAQIVASYLDSDYSISFIGTAIVFSAGGELDLSSQGSTGRLCCQSFVVVILVAVVVVTTEMLRSLRLGYSSCGSGCLGRLMRYLLRPSGECLPFSADFVKHEVEVLNPEGLRALHFDKKRADSFDQLMLTSKSLDLCVMMAYCYSFHIFWSEH